MTVERTPEQTTALATRFWIAAQWEKLVEQQTRVRFRRTVCRDSFKVREGAAGSVVDWFTLGESIVLAVKLDSPPDEMPESYEGEVHWIEGTPEFAELNGDLEFL